MPSRVFLSGFLFYFFFRGASNIGKQESSGVISTF